MRAIKAIVCALLCVLLLAVGTGDAAAQAKYPSRPIRLLIPFAPGGGVDVVARIVGQKISEAIGQPILIESKPGGGGLIAVNELMRSEPDGYTLLVTTSAHATLPALNKLAWHPSDDFSPIATINFYMFVLSTNSANASRFRTFGEFVSYVRTHRASAPSASS